MPQLFQEQQEPFNDKNLLNRYIVEQGKLKQVISKDSLPNSFELKESQPAPGVGFSEYSGVYTEYIKLWPLWHASFNDPLSSMVSSRTMLLPHQVDAALRIIESVNPRFLIADEVGLGKTIETGLIIKELILKYNFDRVLICVPSSLLNQWQNEMLTKFNESFTIVTGDMLRKKPSIIHSQKKILISIDLAKDLRYRSNFLREFFDIVVFDEAHRLRRDMNKVTKAYSFAEAIARNTRALLLLSATPFRGKLEEIYYLVQLIDPDILGPINSFLAKFSADGQGDLRHRLQPVVVRRRKVDVGGFTKRIARTVKLSLTPMERTFYDATTQYVKREYNRAVAQGQRMKGFVMITFQKLLDSSSFALLSALRKRKARLEEIYFQALRGSNPLFVQREAGKDLTIEFLRETVGDEQECEDFFDDEDVDDLEVVFDPAEMLLEIQALTKLLELGTIIKNESKLTMLIKTIREMQRGGHERFLIFTQFKSTLFFLKEELASSFKVAVFHGSMTNKEKEQAIADFYEKDGSKILILTEAGGEGRNLQIASALFNYDLPWSPLKIEQRIGRIHRFGQKRDVHVVNFATRDTVAERVLEVLENKIQLFEHALGESDVLLGILEDELRFSENFNLFLKEKKGKKEIQLELTKSLDLARASISKIEKLFSPEFMDFNMQAFVKAAQDNGGVSDPQRENYLAGIVHALAAQLGLPMKMAANKTVVINGSGERLGTFSQSKAEEQGHLEYLTFGHPDIDQMIQRLVSAVEKDKVCEAIVRGRGGWLFLCEVTITADKSYRRIYPIILRDTVELMTIDLAPNITFLQKSTQTWRDHFDILERALVFLWPIICKDRNKILARIAGGVDFWRSIVAESHNQKSDELNEKLQVQRGKMKWYHDKNMAGVITRTVNKKNEEVLRAQKRLRHLRENLSTNVEITIRHLCKMIPESSD